MALSKKPVTGMKDILPEEMKIRDYVISVIKETYGKFGFTSIETPCVENIENLTNKQGGENEKLIFKILKRGEKLNLEAAKEEKDLVDGGLRLKHFRWEMYGVLTDRSVVVTVSSCSVILIFWENPPTWQRSS